MTGIHPYETRDLPAAVDAAYRTISECTAQIDEGRDFIVLVLSNRNPPTAVNARLTPGGGPTGEILVYHDDRREIVARFRPHAVRRWLQKRLREAGWEA